jgi:hypothetical protein
MPRKCKTFTADALPFAADHVAAMLGQRPAFTKKSRYLQPMRLRSRPRLAVAPDIAGPPSLGGLSAMADGCKLAILA